MASISKIQGCSIPFSIDLTQLEPFTSVKFEIYELSTFNVTNVFTYVTASPDGTITKAIVDGASIYSFTLDTSSLLGGYGIEMTWVKNTLTDKAQCGTISIEVEAKP